uniref:ATP synthase complex subunit 8 n=1 Tax=Leiopelma hochstetteri TaxID=51644 RepID=A0A0F6NCG8_LEIHO|nr:ATP synthase F0 subunit 8 [Leiopelma hochstetteri]AII41073.1 ATP synthase F0 subunit 8 [Leiopelma hochstetteri]
MPQLNPGPWLAVFLLSWLILTLVLPNKIISHQPINEPPKDLKKSPPSHWIWPWT